MSTGGIQPWMSRELPGDTGAGRRREEENRLAWQQEMERALMQAWFAHGPIEKREDTLAARNEQPVARSETGAGVAARHAPAARQPLPMHALGPWTNTERVNDAGQPPPLPDRQEAPAQAPVPIADAVKAHADRPPSAPTAIDGPRSGPTQQTDSRPGAEAIGSGRSRNVVALEADLAGRLSSAGFMVVSPGNGAVQAPLPGHANPLQLPQTSGPTTLAGVSTGLGRDAGRAVAPQPLGRAQETASTQLPGTGPQRSAAVPGGSAAQPAPTARLSERTDVPGRIARGESRGQAQPQPQPEIRVHAEWLSDGVRIWIGADAPALQQMAAVLERLREWMRAHDLRVIEIVCNGRPVKPGANPGPEYHQEKRQWPSTP